MTEKQFAAKLASLESLDLKKAIVYVERTFEREMLRNHLNRDGVRRAVMQAPTMPTSSAVNLRDFIELESVRYLLGGRGLAVGWRAPAGSTIVFWDPSPITREEWEEQLLARPPRDESAVIHAVLSDGTTRSMRLEDKPPGMTVAEALGIEVPANAPGGHPVAALARLDRPARSSKARDTMGPDLEYDGFADGDAYGRND